MSAPTIRELGVDSLPSVVGVIARGMRDNPIHIRALGSDEGQRSKRLQQMFAIVMPAVFRKGAVIGAFDGPTLLGIAGQVPSDGCQLSSIEKLTVLPRLMPAVGLTAFVRIGRWIGVWAQHDPREPHVHLGPVAVDLHLQGHGIGSALMREYCARLDRTSAVGYFETDKPQNVTFYEKFGFRTIAEAQALEIPNWFMRRPAVSVR